jgi:hypothetical protein
MPEYRIAIFDPRKRIKELEELIYPSIFYSMRRTGEEKIRALYWHKIRIGTSIERIGDAEKREGLYNRLDELYVKYLALFGFAAVVVRRCEVEVENELNDKEAERCAGENEELPADVSITTRWIKARVRMLLAQVLKKSYSRQVYAWEERTLLEADLSSLEWKLSRESDSRMKADILEDIERVRGLLLMIGE